MALFLLFPANPHCGPFRETLCAPVGPTYCGNDDAGIGPALAAYCPKRFNYQAFASFFPPVDRYIDLAPQTRPPLSDHCPAPPPT